MARKPSVPFSWKKHLDSLQKKNEYRVSRLAVTNPSFQVLHPNLQREAAKGLDAEIKKYAKEKVEKQIKKAIVPPVIRPVRLNRIE